MPVLHGCCQCELLGKYESDFRCRGVWVLFTDMKVAAEFSVKPSNCANMYLRKK